MIDKKYTNFVAKFIINELQGMLRKYKATLEDCPIFLIRMILDCEYYGLITRWQTKEVLKNWFESGRFLIENNQVNLSRD